MAFLFDAPYLCTRKTESKYLTDIRNAGVKTLKKMTTQNHFNTIMMLQYRIERYQAMGNGIKCQELRSQLNALQKGSQAVALA